MSKGKFIAVAVTVASLVLVVGGLLGWRMFFVTDVDNYELCFTFDRWTGKIERVHQQGWVTRMPFRYSVHTIDLRPYQVTMNANERVLNAKLVRFNPDGLQTFVEWHGRDAGDSKRNLLEILKSYAFDPDGGKDCPFLEVKGQITPTQSIPVTPLAERKLGP